MSYGRTVRPCASDWFVPLLDLFSLSSGIPYRTSSIQGLHQEATIAMPVYAPHRNFNGQCCLIGKCCQGSDGLWELTMQPTLFGKEAHVEFVAPLWNVHRDLTSKATITFACSCHCCSNHQDWTANVHAAYDMDKSF